jgi:serine/threonine protein kinase/DNA-binding winged helix-turn-helix (wHTH) protein/tetratricopeptide (TPR) repeat protein
VLAMLASQSGQVVTREEIQKQVWGSETYVDFDHGLNQCIKQIRTVLNDNADRPVYVETVPRRGYRFLIPVTSKTVAAPAPKVVESASGVLPSLPAVAQTKAVALADISVPEMVSPDGAAAQLQLESAGLTGKTVSHYRVIGVLGGGGMGVVYHAEDLKLGRAVALKFLPDEVRSDPRTLERFEREARAASSLDHPNICSIYEFGEHERRPFIVMQLLEGQTLRDYLASGGLKGPEASIDLDRLLNIAIQIVDGLEAAHQKGIVHRDIKPANIFITTKGTAKILDFGLAKPIQTGERKQGCAEITGEIEIAVASTPQGEPLAVSRPTTTKGTAAYMSPEQIRGEKLDARSDLFSFGLVLYEMATSQRAFSGEDTEIVTDAILHQTPVPLLNLDPDLPPGLQEVVQRCSEKDRNLRYQDAAAVRSALEQVKRREKPLAMKRWGLLTAAAVMVLALIAVGLYWRSRQTALVLTEKDTIVLADFVNTTGDAVFDDTLKQGLSVQLDQSPFIAQISERKVNDTLKRMGHVPGDPLAPEVAREVCQRTGSKAMLIGSIASLGSQYVIGLKAVNCNTGEVLAEAQETAAAKEGVLKALSAAAVSLRSKLGESITSVQRYATPLVEATTPSLEALKAYSMGRKMRFAKSEMAALPFYKRAVEIDPNFALPYAGMAAIYNNLNEVGRSAENASKAYELRGKVSDKERFSIEGTYYMNATGELEKAADVYEQWRQAYPRDFVPYGNMGSIAANLGNWEKALEESRDALRLEPNNATVTGNVGLIYASLNRLDDAEEVYKQAEERKLKGELLLENRYLLAFLKGDPTEMAQVASAATGKPGTEDLLLASKADTEAWYGKLKNARELTGRAMELAQRNDAKENAASYQVLAGLREVESGNWRQARADAEAAVSLAPNRDVQAMAALILARAGDTVGADKLAEELDHAFPLDTLVQRYWLPTIRAAVALQHKDPNGAIELLKAASSTELGQPKNLTVFLCPVYLRGEAYLMLRDGNAAAAEFKKFIDHYGLVANFPWGALARLGLARSYGIEGDTAKARPAYQDFLTLWKDADPDVPILLQAKAEYAKLK